MREASFAPQNGSAPLRFAEEDSYGLAGGGTPPLPGDGFGTGEQAGFEPEMAAGRRLSQGTCTVLMDDFGQVYGFGQRPAAAVGW